jgi:hypothetical protein
MHVICHDLECDASCICVHLLLQDWVRLCALCCLDPALPSCRDVPAARGWGVRSHKFRYWRVDERAAHRAIVSETSQALAAACAPAWAEAQVSRHANLNLQETTGVSQQGHLRRALGAPVEDVHCTTASAPPPL